MGRFISIIAAMLFSIAINAQITFTVSTPQEDSNGDWLVNICMNNGSTVVTGFQCDLTIPSDFSYEMGSYSFTDRCKKLKQGKMMDTHNLTGDGVTNGGTIRMDIFSNDIDEIQDIQGSDGSVVTIKLSGLSTAKATPLNLTNIVVVTLDEDGFPSVDPVYSPRVIGDSTLSCTDYMGSDIMVIGSLSDFQKKEMNNNMETADVITNIDLSLCTDDNLGTLSIPDGSDPTLYLANKGQVTNTTTNMYYKSGDDWVVSAIDLVDGVSSYSLDKNLVAETGSYTRNFKNLNWQAWYLPFTIPVSTVSDELSFAEVTGITEDDESIYITTKYVTEGNLKPNYPYFVQAKTTGSRKMEWENVKASKTVANSKVFASANSSFTFTGTYSRKTDMYANGSYAMAGGALAMAESADVTLGAFRWFMDYSETAAGARKRCVLSFGEADAIKDVNANAEEPSRVYDSNGRPVTFMGKGVYIVNGRKFMK